MAAVQAALSARYQPLVTCGADLGMRQGEIFALSPDDLIRHIRHGRAVHVQRQVKIIGSRPVFAPPKGGKERDIPLPADVEARLMAHAERFPPAEVTLPWLTPDGPLVTVRLFFTNDAGGAIYRSTFNHHWWARDLKAAGVEPGRENGMHALRHHYASVMLAGGVDIRALSEFLGHTDPRLHAPGVRAPGAGCGGPCPAGRVGGACCAVG